MSDSGPGATVPLNVAELPSAYSIADQLCKKKLLLGVDPKGEILKQDGHELLIQFNGPRLAIRLIDEPIEPELLENRCVLSSWWPDALSTVKCHTARLELSATNERWNLVENSVFLTHAVAETLHLVQADGVFWGDGILTKRSDFLELANRVGFRRLVASLWVNVKCIHLEKHDYCLTMFGMADFDRHDLEIDRFTANQPEKIVQMVCSLVESWLLNQIVLEHDQVIDGPGQSKISVRAGKSFLRPTAEVLKLEFR